MERDQRVGIMRSCTVLAASVALILAVPILAEAGTLGALGYNLEQWSFSASAAVGFSQQDVHVKTNRDIDDEATSSRFGIKLAFAPLNWLDVYGLVGAADWRLDEGSFKGVLGTHYGGGVRLRLFPWFWEETGIFNFDVDSQASAMSTSDDKVDAYIWEYQWSGILSKEFQLFTLYGGAKYVLGGVNFSPGGTGNMSPDMFWGVFIGVDYFVTPYIFFSTELNIFTKTAISLGVGFKY